MSRIVTTFICLLITVILIITLVLPKKEALDFSQKRIEEKKAEIQGKEEYFNNLKQLLKELQNYKTQLSKIDLALPEDPSLPLLFDFLQKSTSQSGLVLTSIKFLPPSAKPALKEKKSEFQSEQEKPEFRETKIDLTVSGNYSSFKNFLSVLEKSARLIELESLIFSTISTKPGEEVFKFDLKIKSYSY